MANCQCENPISSTSGTPVISIPTTLFVELLKEIEELHKKKQQDYGTDRDPFANIRGSQEWGIRPWIGAMVRAQDKIKRIQKYAREGNLANESVRDSFMDLAVYSLIACLLWEEEWEEKYEC